MGCGVSGPSAGAASQFKIPEEVKTKFEKEGNGEESKLMKLLEEFFKANPHAIPNSTPDNPPV